MSARRRGHPQNPKQLRIDASCITGVNPNHTHGLGVWNNPREVFSVRIDRELAKAFKPVAMAKFGSTCRAIESYMVGLVGIAKGEQVKGVYPSNTSIAIGEMNIVREMRSRRKLTHTVEEETETVESETVLRCSVANCLSDGKSAGVAVGKALYLPRQEEYDVCDYHLTECLNDRRNWRVS